MSNLQPTLNPQTVLFKITLIPLFLIAPFLLWSCQVNDKQKRVSNDVTQTPDSSQLNLVTSKGDFRKLDQLLSSQRWREADGETTTVMFGIMNIMGGGLVTDSCRMPPIELRIIDQLWLKYSNNKFGFSVQKQIWLKSGGKLNSNSYGNYTFGDGFDRYTFEKLGDQVGWTKEGNFLRYSDLTFNISTAPQGHLPSFVNAANLKMWDGMAIAEGLGRSICWGGAAAGNLFSLL